MSMTCDSLIRENVEGFYFSWDWEQVKISVKSLPVKSISSQAKYSFFTDKVT
jgi:hypothetical protein